MRTGIRADIQGLRAVAVLVVIAFHAGLPVTGGFVGVDVSSPSPASSSPRC